MHLHLHILQKENVYEDHTFPTKVIPDDAQSNVTVCENLYSERTLGTVAFTLFDKEMLRTRLDVHESEGLWHCLQHSSVHSKIKYFNSSNSSGYETESDISPESREYFIAREIDLDR